MKRTSDLAFDRFWELYPRKVAKLAAQKAFARAAKSATPEQIYAGVELYRQHLPEEMQFVAHAATWLNQGRWLDEYEDAVTISKLQKVLRPSDRPRADISWEGHECPHGGTCATPGICQFKSSAERRQRGEVA